jgi:hypothetical protein
MGVVFTLMRVSILLPILVLSPEQLTDLDNPAANYVTARPFYPYIFQDTMFQRIEEWLKHCGTHIECAQAMERSLELNRGRGPARLLYVNSSNTSSIRLVERKMNMEYIALSYCWGGDDSMKLTNLEFDSWAQSIPVINLPKTIRDAIICTRRLGLDYLWVDRLCIIQDNAADVTQQIAVMPEIYGMAYLTLSASSAVTSQDGFLQSRDEVSSKFSRSRIALLYICPDGSTGSITLAPSQELSDSLTPGTLAVDRHGQCKSKGSLGVCYNFVPIIFSGNATQLNEFTNTPSSHAELPIEQ